VGTQDGFLQVWRQSVGTQGPRGDSKASQLTMRGYPGKVTCLAWHPSRSLIATAGGPDVVLWDLPRTGKGAKGQPLRNHQKTVTSLAWSPDGRLLASGDRDGRLCIWGAKGELIFSQDMTREIAVIAWQPDGMTLAVGDTGGRLQVLGSDSHASDSIKTTPDPGDNR
jgi:WD40 repeat protein